MNFKKEKSKIEVPKKGIPDSFGYPRPAPKPSQMKKPRKTKDEVE